MHILIPKGTSERSAMWTLMDLITQQIVLQKKKKKKKNRFNPDSRISLINIDVNKALSNLKIVIEESKKKKSIKFKSSRRRIKKKRWIKNFYMKL